MSRQCANNACEQFQQQSSDRFCRACGSYLAPICAPLPVLPSTSERRHGIQLARSDSGATESDLLSPLWSAGFQSAEVSSGRNRVFITERILFLIPIRVALP